jgi:ATP-binding cassette, subfamily C (CFTR/MRP), member 4
MYAWEIPFQKLVGEKRANELKQVKLTQLMRAIFIGFMVFTERAALFVSILVFILLGNSMTANIVSDD